MNEKVEAMTAKIKQLQEDLRKEQERVINEELGAILADLCRDMNLPGVYLYGYTPGFNDGDPCVHSQSTGEWYEGEDTLHGAHFEDEEQEKVAEASNKALGEWRSEARTTIEGLFEPLEDALQAAFGTDWWLLWTYDEVAHRVDLSRGYYECGY